jgi:hypothetical protein
VTLELFMMKDDDFRSQAEPAWKERRAELLPAFIEDHPGHRPTAWWMFDAPELRRVVSGGGSLERRAGDWYYDSAPWGCPRLWYGSNLDEVKAEFETELIYLTRLNLLTEGELERLAVLKGADDE